MKHCAFLTLDDPTGFVIDDALAHEPLAALGWQVSTLSWRQTEVAWDDFDAVIIRSTWDYQAHSDEFMRVLEDIDRGRARLANSLSLVRWNLAKTYLRELEKCGVPIVPTLWADSVEVPDFHGWFDVLEAPELVIKPVIGANGDNAYRIHLDDAYSRLSRIAECHNGRKFMVQPFMPTVLSEGEFSLFFFNGQYSHAILKTPAPAEFRSQEERGAELTAVKPTGRLLHRARQTLHQVRQGAATPALYARIDLVRDAEDDFRVMEVELIEPSLYLRMDPGAPDRFAHAVEEWFKAV